MPAKFSVTDYRPKLEAFIEFPFRYPSLNEWGRMHHFKQNKVKQKFMNDVAVILASKAITPFPGPVKITIDLLFIKKQHRRDNDNYTPKFLLDALVKCGIIVDDNRDIVQDCDVMTFSKCERDGMTVKIEELK